MLQQYRLRSYVVANLILACLLLGMVSVSFLDPLSSSPSRHGKGGSRLFTVAAPLRPLKFKTSIANTVGCITCQSIASHALLYLQLFMVRTNKTQVAQYEVEDFLEHICDSNNIAGAWIRRIGLSVVPDEKEGESRSAEEEEKALSSSVGDDSLHQKKSSPSLHSKVESGINSSLVHLEVRQHSGYAKCNRVCETVQDYCQFIKDYSSFDDFSREVALLSKKEGPLHSKENEKELHTKICSRYFSCEHRKRIMMSAARDLNNDPELRASVENDPVEFIPFDQLPNEFSSFQSQKKNSLQAFTAEELRTLEVALSFEDENSAARRANREWARLGTLKPDEFLSVPSGVAAPKEDFSKDDKSKIVKGSRYGRFSSTDL